MTSRERVMRALNFQPVDRVPKDLSGMRSTGVSAFTYSALRRALGLPDHLPMVYDQWQMLALPQLDVLDALGCDVVTVEGGELTNAFPQPELWQRYDYGGRLPALIRDPAGYHVEPDGTVVRDRMRMPPAAHTFDEIGAGQQFSLDGETPRPDLKQVRSWLDKNRITDQRIRQIVSLCKRVRASTDRAVFFAGPLTTGLCIHGHGGVAVFPVLCLEDPDFVHELHSMVLEASLQTVRALLPEIKDYIDIALIDADDWGNQNALMAPPYVFRDLFLPYRKRHSAEIHRIAPHVKTFLHSCGAIYDLIDMLIEAGIDILNPVQWPAGGHTPAQWKAKAKGKLSFWGGGANSQHTLPRGSIEEIQREVRETVPVLAEGGGYVFANIHNLLAEVTPEKIIALYRACPC
jgi:uroporphyrinogen decarboxylase